jgi:predicted SAM-dependent methyltransferase
MMLLNIGCGSNYHPSWVNVDVNPVSQEIIRHDAGTPLPFKDSSFEACYCSHVLEHLSCDTARLLVAEIHRVLKSGGIFRVVVPDLEVIVRTYLSVLEQAMRSEKGAEHSYDWMKLELLDQMVRVTSGGQMETFFSSCPIDSREFILSRIGIEAECFWDTGQPQSDFISTIFRKYSMIFINKIRLSLMCGFAGLIAGKRGMRAVKEGWFRTSGEVHRWMYDRFSLERLLRKANFNALTVCTPDDSRIPDFASYKLDVTGGVVRKPDSLVMECVKP